MPFRAPPPSASFATPTDGVKLTAPSAERNCSYLCDLLASVAPAQGKALELASGTGQHVAAFAERLPGLHWQPTEPDPKRRASIDAYVEETGRSNLSRSIHLDATSAGWAGKHSGQSLVVLANLLHLISDIEAATLIAEAARALAPEGRLVIYGPFMRGGELTSDGDAQFHAKLQAADPEIGYKDDFDVLDLMEEAGLAIVQVVEMPANNLGIVAEKPPT